MRASGRNSLIPRFHFNRTPFHAQLVASQTSPVDITNSLTVCKMAQSRLNVSGMSSSQKRKLDDEYWKWIQDDRFGINDILERASRTQQNELDMQDIDFTNGFVTGVIRVSGTEGKQYRLKFCFREEARNAVLAMYQATKILSERLPQHTSALIGYAPYTIDRDINIYPSRRKLEIHCLLEDWQQISERTPIAIEVHPLVIKFHQSDVPYHFGWGKFGSPTAWYDGAEAQWFPMHNNWADCFKEGLRLTIQKEKKVHGDDDQIFNDLCQAMLDRVVDRLLVPMESDGRIVTPTLVHGNLWDDTVKSTGRGFGEPVLMDATPLMAPYEYKWAPWWSERYSIGFSYIIDYLSFAQYNIVEPVDE